MRIQINSDKNVVVDAPLASFTRGEVNRALKRFTHELTRVEVHLSDVNSHKPGALDKRCLMEARPARHRPLTASSRAAKIEEAVKGGLTKLQSSLQTFIGRLAKQRAAAARAVAPRTRRIAEPARPRARKKAASRGASVGQLDHPAPRRRSSS
jgi:hypothetical protein